MRYIYAILTFLFFTFSSAQQNMDTIYGNPKSVRENVLFLKKNLPKEYTEYNSSAFRNISRYRSKSLENFVNNNRVSNINNYKKYNEIGLLQYEVWHDMSGDKEREYYYEYDVNNKLIEEKEVYIDEEYWLTKFHYNQSDKLIAMSYYVSDEPNSFVHWYMVLDKNNNLIETKRIDEEGEDYSIVYELNNQENVTKKIRKYIPNWRDIDEKKSDFLDSITILQEFDYDKHGNKILELGYNEETGRVYSKQIYKYDDINNLIEHKIFFQPSDSTKYKLTKFEYDDSGLKIFEEELSSVDTSYHKSKRTIFNKDEFVIKNIFIENNDFTTVNFQYRFDKKGNWTKITKIVNDEPLYVWTRNIEYYKD